MRFRTKVLFVIAITLVAWVCELAFLSTVQPNFTTDIALGQLENGPGANNAMDTLRWTDLAKNFIVPVAFFGSVLVCFWNDFWNFVSSKF